jgi:hypothetical protein
MRTGVIHNNHTVRFWIWTTGREELIYQPTVEALGIEIALLDRIARKVALGGICRQ